MPFGAIKDLVSRGGRKAAESGKKAAMKAREYDKEMVERHGEDSDAVDQLTGDSHRGMQSPDMALGLDDDGGERQVPDALGGGGDGSPQMPDSMGSRDMDSSDPGVPDLLGENDGDDRLW